MIDWDPSKWIILALRKLGLVMSLRRARNGDLKEAIEYMHRKELGLVEVKTDTWYEVQEYVEKQGKCVVMIDGFVVDVTSYLGDHVSRYLSVKLWCLIFLFVAWRSQLIAKIFCQIGKGRKRMARS